MLLFLLALILGVVGVGAYAYIDGGSHDVAFRSYFHFTAIQDWMLVAGLAAVILFLFLVQAIYASIRIRMLRGSDGDAGRSTVQRTEFPISR